MRVVNIALLGFGTVGTGSWDVIEKNRQQIADRLHANVVVSKILVLDKTADFGRQLAKGVLTEDFTDILNDETIEIVVEVTGTVEPALDFMTRALQAGKHVVTANKYVISRWGKPLFETAEQAGKSLYIEATVGGGIPIIREFAEGMAANQIESFYGILNGTTNYMLDKMLTDQMDYAAALKRAQQLGYAELDPTGDVKGYDAVNKLAILAMLAFNLSIQPDDIDTIGIDALSDVDLALADQLGYRIKLLAIGQVSGATAKLGVYPALIPKVHLLATVGDSFNAIFIKGNVVDDIMLYGRGAGALPTGSAIVADIMSIIQQGKRPLPFNLTERYRNDSIVQSARKQPGKWYLRLPATGAEHVSTNTGIEIISQCQHDELAFIIRVTAYAVIEDLQVTLADQDIVHQLIKIELED